MPSSDPSRSSILSGVPERFAASRDFTIGIEEELQILDPDSLELANRIEELLAIAPEELGWHLDHELVASEIEFKTRPHDSFPDAARELIEGRLAACALARQCDAVLAISGAHPFSLWSDQTIASTPRYRRLVEELGYVAWINNTWALHLHCGVRDADRAVRVSTRLREVLPQLLALSANSPFLDNRDTLLASARTQLFARNLPRSGISDAFDGWDDYARYVAFLERAGSIRDAGMLWWSVRPHHQFGTVEVRICDGQTDVRDSLAICALIYGLVAATCDDVDAGRPWIEPRRGLIEENLWRAERHGLDGALIDLPTGDTVPTRQALAALVDRVEPHADRLQLSPWLARVNHILEHGNGAIVQRALAAEADGNLRAVHAEIARRTHDSAEAALRDLPDNN